LDFRGLLKIHVEEGIEDGLIKTKVFKFHTSRKAAC
jgi:hypothetical protein